MESDSPLSEDGITQFVQNLSAREQLQDLGEDPAAYGQLFEDVADVEPVDPDVPRIGDPLPPPIAPPVRPSRSSGVGTTPNRQPSNNDLVQQALDQSDLNLSTPATSGQGTSNQQRPPPPRRSNTARSRRNRTATATRTTRSRRNRTTTATGSARTRRTRSAGSARTRGATAPPTTSRNTNQGRMQQQLRILLDDIAADQREISNIVTTNTVTTTYKQNRRRPTVTNTRTAVGNNPRNRPTVRRTSTRVTG